MWEKPTANSTLHGKQIKELLLRVGNTKLLFPPNIGLELLCKAIRKGKDIDDFKIKKKKKITHTIVKIKECINLKM